MALANQELDINDDLTTELDVVQMRATLRNAGIAALAVLAGENDEDDEE